MVGVPPKTLQPVPLPPPPPAKPAAITARKADTNTDDLSDEIPF
jgi:hypothetical protein